MHYNATALFSLYFVTKISNGAYLSVLRLKHTFFKENFMSEKFNLKDYIKLKDGYDVEECRLKVYEETNRQKIERLKEYEKLIVLLNIQKAEKNFFDRIEESRLEAENYFEELKDTCKDIKTAEEKMQEWIDGQFFSERENLLEDYNLTFKILNVFKAYLKLMQNLITTYRAELTERYCKKSDKDDKKLEKYFKKF